MEEDRIITQLIHTTDGNKFPQSGVSAYFQAKYYTTEIENSQNLIEDQLLFWESPNMKLSSTSE